MVRLNTVHIIKHSKWPVKSEAWDLTRKRKRRHSPPFLLHYFPIPPVKSTDHPLHLSFNVLDPWPFPWCGNSGIISIASLKQLGLIFIGHHLSTYACWLLTSWANLNFITNQMGDINTMMVLTAYGDWMPSKSENQVEVLNINFRNAHMRPIHAQKPQIALMSHNILERSLFIIIK